MRTQDHPADPLATLRRRRDDGITFLYSGDDLAGWRDSTDVATSTEALTDEAATLDPDAHLT